MLLDVRRACSFGHIARAQAVAGQITEAGSTTLQPKALNPNTCMHTKNTNPEQATVNN